MLKISICDDEKVAIESFCDFLKDYAASKQMRIQVSTYYSGKTLLASRKVFDVIFIDIDMVGMNGLDTAKEIRKNDTSVKIVYVTNYSEYKDMAFAVHAFAYIVKPVVKENIYQIIDEVIKYSEPKDEGKQEIKFLFKDGVKTFNVKDILYFEYVDRKVALHASNGGVCFLSGEKISNIAKRMDIYNFGVPHKSFVVNLYQVDYIKGYNVCMVDGCIIPLSQNYSKNFRRKVEVFLKRQT